MAPLNLQSTIRMNNGVEIPRFGLGTFQSKKGEETYNAVRWALEIGYRHIDTAAVYGNEEDVGRAIADSGIPREDIFIVTKVWNDDQGYENTFRALEASLRRLKTDYVDLYLVHWPVKGLRHETWKAMVEIYKQGKARSVGVSNYTIRHLEELLPNTELVPAANQIEFSPFLYRKALLDYCVAHGIVVEAYSPLARARKLEDPRLVAMAQKYGKTPAQIALRWAIQHDLVVIPKSVRRERILENASIFDFELSPEDMAEMDTWNEDYWTISESFHPERSPRWE
ncbi:MULTISPECIES: aldo/keto reductase [Anaerolinea]|uniref:aldo/keto reductase n=1 Tax=Anaerolinea TaxID=233189 RepID=UPI00260F3D47|nr:aldo/keto reductase [Anaerolinea thermophila]